MIDFRYHLVSIIAVFLALTVGLALGSTMLQDPLLDTLKSETADLRGQSEDLRTERDVSERVGNGADEMVDAAAGDLLEDRLLDLDVVTVAAPGADENTLTSLDRRIEQAGGEAAGRVELSEKFLNEGEATFLDELAVQVSPEADDLAGSPHTKAGTELGRALASSGGDRGSDGDGADAGAEPASDDRGSHDAEAALSAFDEAELLTVTGSPAEAADALVVVAPGEETAEQGAEGETTGAALDTLTEALHAEVGPTVLAADPSSADHGHMLAQVREGQVPYSTVDVAGRAVGDVVTVLALSAEVQGDGGSFGIGEGTQGFLPDPLPAALEDGGEVRDLDDEARRTARDGG
ncbi:copper transporter [Nocardiopsis sp. HNM0947]|uniref:Copper transporter n=1 Tax=Nocardiopsis coralli TaxID=2772213 RepID=A0ABR9P7D9_9ACTN|nr:copper transporter [Nocardiopsis coralli]MBE2999755.1 copper transporter [Nocardiopsis coralli]